MSSKQQTRREAVRDGQTKRWVLQNVLSINQNADSDHSYSTSTHTTCLKNQSVPDISLVEKEEVVGEDGTSLTEKSAAWRQGRRIVELGFLADALSACNVCGSPLHLSDCAGIFECGLGSVLSVVCRNSACSFVNKISTGKKTSRKWDVNGKLNFGKEMKHFTMVVGFEL